MVVVVLLLVVVIGALVALLVTTRRDLTAAQDELVAAEEARTAATAAAERSAAAADTAMKERDDALERAARARRDAADVARRMQEEAEARAAAEAETRSTMAERERLEVELAAAEEAAADGGEERIAELWALALAGVRRTWDVSVCPSPGMPCPLDTDDIALRAALGIEVDAAREEAGATVELVWTGSGEITEPTALRTLSIGQELIARLSKTAEQAALVVDVADDGAVALTVEATDLEGGDVVPADVATEHLVGPGRYRLGA